MQRVKLAAAPKGTRKRRRSQIWLLRNVSRAAQVLQRSGYLSTKLTQELLNEILRDKLTEIRSERGVTEPLPDRITFEHLDSATFDLLGVVVVTIGDGQYRDLHRGEPHREGAGIVLHQDAHESLQ